MDETDQMRAFKKNPCEHCTNPMQNKPNPTDTPKQKWEEEFEKTWSNSHFHNEVVGEGQKVILKSFIKSQRSEALEQGYKDGYEHAKLEYGIK